jgi:hypothetical protein
MPRTYRKSRNHRGGNILEDVTTGVTNFVSAASNKVKGVTSGIPNMPWSSNQANPAVNTEANMIATESPVGGSRRRYRKSRQSRQSRRSRVRKWR